MYIIVFLVFLALYAATSTKVEEWSVISILGFRLETPQGFMDRPGAYTFVERALLLGAALSAAAADSFRLATTFSVLVLAIAVVYFASKFVGRKLAYSTFRRNHRLLAEDETDPEKLAELETGARLTDKELKERLDLLSEHAI